MSSEPYDQDFDTPECESQASTKQTHMLARIAAIETSRLVLEQKLAAAQKKIAGLFEQLDRSQRERHYWEGKFEEIKLPPLAGGEAEAAKPALFEEILARRIVRLAAGIPRPARRAIKRIARIGRRVKHSPPQISSSEMTQPTLEIAAPELPEMPLRRWGEDYGAVSHATLEKAVARLRRFELFDAENYLGRNLDVKDGGFDPYRHFVQAGAFEDRGRIDLEELARVMGSFMLMGNVAKAAPRIADDFSVLPELVARIPHIGIYVSSFGNLFMEEIAGDLARDLISVGVRVDVLDETSAIDDRPPVCLFVAPHEFFTLGAGPNWVREDVLSRAFMFGTEQVQTKWFNLALPFMLMSRGVLDICAQTAMILGEAGVPALHVLPGARQRPPGLTESDRQHPLFRVLLPAAKFEPEPARGFQSRPIDLSFFGNGSQRRTQFLARNAAFLSEYESFIYCRTAERGPLLGRGQESALTRIGAHVAGHSKITLNIHRDDLGFFEWHRMVRLGMCSGSVVVSDPCLPHPDFIAGEHYLQEQTRRIPDLLEWLLRTEDGGRAAEKIRSNVNDLITNVFDVRRTMAQLLGFLAQHAEIG